MHEMFHNTAADKCASKYEHLQSHPDLVSILQLDVSHDLSVCVKTLRNKTRNHFCDKKHTCVLSAANIATHSDSDVT